MPLYRRRPPTLLPAIAELHSLSNAYSGAFAPLFAAGADAPAICRAMAETLKRQVRVDAVRLDSLDRASPLWDALVLGFGQAGFGTASYFHFVNRYARLRELSFEEYWQSRPSQLRHTVERKQRQLAKRHQHRYELVTMPGLALETALQGYQRIYAASWKEPEPHPAFIPTLVRRMAAEGVLRLGLLWIDDLPVAGQIWLVAGEQGTIFKLAYDESMARWSPGSLLTAWMFRQVLRSDRVVELDFGRHDDAYKRDWLAESRERWGLIAYRRDTPGGLAVGLRHHLGPKLKRLFQLPRV